MWFSCRSTSRLAPFVVLAALGAGCGGKAPTEPGAAGGATLDAARAVHATVGSEGDTLTTQGADGVTYVLEIPSGALMANAAVVMTPVTALPSLHVSGGRVGAVALEPEGLLLTHAATLRIRTAAHPSAGQHTIGFAGGGSGDSLGLDIAVAGTGEIDIPVTHFSIHGSGFGTTADLATFPAPPLGSSNQSYFDRLMRLSLPVDSALATPLLHDWLQQVILPEVGGAANDAALLIACHDYEVWRTMIDYSFTGQIPLVPLSGGTLHTSPAAFSGDIALAGTDAALPLRSAIAGNDSVACAHASFTALANEFFWQEQAVGFGIADQAHQLDLPSVLLRSCVQLRLLSSTTIPGIQSGVAQSVPMQFAVSFFGMPAPVPAAFSVSLTGAGCTIQHPSGNTDAAGNYTTVITPDASGSVAITATACVIPPGSTRPLPMCGTFHLLGGASCGFTVNVTGNYAGIVGHYRDRCCGASHYTDLAKGEEDETWTMSLDQVGCNFTGTWASSGAGHSGSVSGHIVDNSHISIIFECSCGGAMGATNANLLTVDANGHPGGVTLRLMRHTDCHYPNGGVDANNVIYFMDGLLSRQ